MKVKYQLQVGCFSNIDRNSKQIRAKSILLSGCYIDMAPLSTTKRPQISFMACYSPTLIIMPRCLALHIQRSGC